MTPARTALVDGVPVPLADCDWVLLAACGCPLRVTLACLDPAERDAWVRFYDSRRPWAAIARAIRRGERAVLVTHELYAAELAPLTGGPCPHQPPGEQR